VARHYRYTTKPKFRAVRDSKLNESPAARQALRQSRGGARGSGDGGNGGRLRAAG
jgi:hypothetical protein